MFILEMILNALQILLILIIFFPIRYTTYQVTDVWGLPEWLNYKPWNCYLCLTFWTLLFIYLSVGLIFNLKITLFGGILLTVMNALAMWIDQKHKTIKIEDPYEDIKGTYDYNIEEVKDELKNKFNIEIIDLDK